MNKDYYKLAKMCHDTVMQIKKYNNEPDWNISFDDETTENKNMLYEFIQNIIKNPDITGEKIHNDWANYKIKNGWKYGRQTDRKNKIHNCLIPFDELTPLQKLKDDVIITIIKNYINV